MTVPSTNREYTAKISADITFDRTFGIVEAEDIQLEDAWIEETKEEPSGCEFEELENIVLKLDNIDWRKVYLDFMENEYYEGKEDCYD